MASLVRCPHRADSPNVHHLLGDKNYSGKTDYFPYGKFLWENTGNLALGTEDTSNLTTKQKNVFLSHSEPQGNFLPWEEWGWGYPAVPSPSLT